MREILFKAKRKDNGKWIEGYYVNVAKINPFICTGRINGIGVLKGFLEPEMHAIDPDTLCQYTGLNDKNGNKIWENDIVRYTFDSPNDVIVTINGLKERISSVFWSEWRGSWSVYADERKSKLMNNNLFNFVRNGNTVEVIGNIFDNPELLEKETK